MSVQPALHSEEYKRYLFEYRFDDAEWGIEIVAKSANEARDRLKALGWTRYRGEIKAKIPVPGTSSAIRAVMRCQKYIQKLFS